MQVYRIEFFNVKSETIVGMGTYYSVYHNDYYSDKNNRKHINLGKKPVLIVKECDLDLVKNYGDGIKSLNYIGNLLESNNENDGLIINVSCNLVGTEDVEKVIEELQNKISKLRVNLTV
ncbi:MAG: hypothetical protein PHI87_05735 [Candidatus Methanomethylophilus sp.]|nr:hypothetical protein [Methanomethylophilus sp.]